jgi:hypothetical protein
MHATFHFLPPDVAICWSFLEKPDCGESCAADVQVHSFEWRRISLVRVVAGHVRARTV